VDISDVPTPAVAAFLKGKPLAHFVGGCDADLFLLDLARAVAIKTGEKNWTPQIIHDPLGHLLAEVAPVGDFPRDEKNKDDLLSLWKQRLTAAKIDYDAKFGGDNALVAAQAQADTAAVAEAMRDAGPGPSGEVDRAAYWAKLNEAYEEYEQGYMAEAAAACAEAAALDPNGHIAFNNWGLTLSDMAMRGGPDADRRFTEACAKFEAALAIKPEDHEVLYNWGNTSLAMAQRGGPDADRLFTEACAKYQAALAIKPDDHETLNNWGNAVLLVAALSSTKPEARPALLEQSADKLQLALRNGSKTAYYNLACVMALSGLPDDCRGYLMAAHEHGRLPSREHLETDTDLDSVRGLPWFAEILALADGKKDEP
jgi:tetratricopeptide (TPR) repeat protein